MIPCRHCEAEATEDTANEGDSFRCSSCGILGTVYLTDRDCDGEAVAYLAFRANKGERCTWDECEECKPRPVECYVAVVNALLEREQRLSACPLGCPWDEHPRRHRNDCVLVVNGFSKAMVAT